MKNFVQEGKHLDHVASSALSSGDVVIMDSLAGVAIADIASGEEGAVLVKGVVELAKENPLVIAQGALVYWTGTEVTTTATGNDLIGVAANAAESAATTVNVLLNA